jgi:hypothetical protein
MNFGLERRAPGGRYFKDTEYRVDYMDSQMEDIAQRNDPMLKHMQTREYKENAKSKYEERLRKMDLSPEEKAIRKRIFEMTLN